MNLHYMQNLLAELEDEECFEIEGGGFWDDAREIAGNIVQEGRIFFDSLRVFGNEVSTIVSNGGGAGIGQGCMGSHLTGC